MGEVQWHLVRGIASKPLANAHTQSTRRFLHDNSGFFYARFPVPKTMQDGADATKAAGTETDSNENQLVGGVIFCPRIKRRLTHTLLAVSQLCFHRLGTDPAEDVGVLRDEEHPLYRFDATVTHDGAVVLIEVRRVGKRGARVLECADAGASPQTIDSCDPVNRLSYINLQDGNFDPSNFKVIKLVDNFGTPAAPVFAVGLCCSSFHTADAGYTYLHNVGRKFFFKTNLKAPRNRIVSIELPPPQSPLEDDPAALASLPWVEVRRLAVCVWFL